MPAEGPRVRPETSLLEDWSRCPVCSEPTLRLDVRLAVAFRRQRCAACGSVLRGRADAMGWRVGAATLLLLSLVLMVVGVLPEPAGWVGVAIAGGIALAPELVFPLRPDPGDPITLRAMRRASSGDDLEPPVSIDEHRERSGR